MLTISFKQAECSILVLARAKLRSKLDIIIVITIIIVIATTILMIRRTDKSEKVWRSALPDITTAITTLRLLR